MTGAFSNTIAAENEQSEEELELGFLEFLGQFETDSGEWIDPDSLLTVEFTELLEATTEANSDDILSNDLSDIDDAANDTQ